MRVINSCCQKHSHRPLQTSIRATPRTGSAACAKASAHAEEQASTFPSSHAAALTRRALGGAALASLITSLAPSMQQPAHAALIEDDIAMQVFDAASPSVVSIINYKAEGGAYVPEGVGTGVVWAGNYIVSNYHCIAKVDKSLIPQLTKVVVTDASGSESRTYSVELAGSDAMHDLAVLRITDAEESLQPIALGRSSELKVGQYVFAIGNTYGLTRTLSAGIVSGLNRSIPSPVGTRINGAIQTDAAINAGNSGGPLLDSSGQMVGLNTATYTRSGTGRGSGVNFALPVTMLLDIVPSLIVYGNAMGRR